MTVATSRLGGTPPKHDPDDGAERLEPRLCPHFRKFPTCARGFTAAKIQLKKQRTPLGMTVAQLVSHLEALRTDDSDAAAWLADLKRVLGGGN